MAKTLPDSRTAHSTQSSKQANKKTSFAAQDASDPPFGGKAKAANPVRLECLSFAGRKEGWYFTKGWLGIGYYQEPPENRAQNLCTGPLITSQVPLSFLLML